MLNATMHIMFNTRNAKDKLLAEAHVVYRAEFNGVLVHTNTVRGYKVWNTAHGLYVSVPEMNFGTKAKVNYKVPYCLDHGVLGAAMNTVLAVNPEADVKTEDLTSKKPVIAEMILAEFKKQDIEAKTDDESVDELA